MPKIALLQMTSGIDPDANARTILDAIEQAKKGGAEMLFTPEMCGLLDQKRKRSDSHIVAEGENGALRAIAKAALSAGLAVHLGSLALANESSSKNINRSLYIDAAGKVIGRYDKIHMFDVQLANGETWKESNAYEPGRDVVTIEDTPLGRLGLTICYDLRFPALFEELGQRQCDAIAIPAAFTRPTGKDHWHILLRARAIEASAFVIAAAQVGKHEDGRETYGHSLVIDPWGDVLLDMGGEQPGLGFCQVNLGRIKEVREQLPSLANRREISK